MVEQELGRPLTEVFDEFAEEPVAAASLAQVYRARLRSTGEVVAVKVQRPGVTDVAVPRVYDEFTSRRLLVSEWVDGVKLSECDPEEIRELTKIGQEAFLVQLLQVGFFHSDPHPGNLLRPHDQSTAKLYLIDFGLVAQVRQEDMDAMISSIIHLANKDYPALVDDFIDLKILPSDCNRAKVVPLMDKALT